MHQKLLSLLCCPACRADLRLFDAPNSGCIDGDATMTCTACGKRYPIVRGIPRFVPTDNYAGNFSFEWTVHNRTQLDSASGRNDSREVFTERMGIDLEFLRGKRILDVGCGTGRLMEYARQYAAEVVGIDISFAVESAAENLHGRENTHVIQADIFNLPLKINTFDFIYSIGVLHHTPDTRRAFLMLPQLLRENGAVTIWVYSADSLYARIKNKFSDFYRIFTTRLPHRLLWSLSHVAIPLYYVKKLPFMRTVLDCVLPMGNDPAPEWRVLDTFDWYSPKYQFKHTYREVTGWFEEAGLHCITRIDYPVAVTGTKKCP